MAGEYNNTPYLLRKSGGGLQYDFSQEIDKIIGGTVAWNQLVQNGNFADTSNWDAYNCTLTVSNNEATITSTASDGNIYKTNGSIPCISSHKYLFIADIKSDGVNNSRIRFRAGDTDKIFDTVSSTYEEKVCILNGATSNRNFCQIEAFAYSNGGKTYLKNIMLTDLTALFGSAEIADYVYSLEQTTAGSGVEWLRNHGFLTKDYYAYNTGSLLSVKTSEHRTVGFNQWDEEWEVGKLDGNGLPTSGSNIRSKNYIPILPTRYFWECSAGNGVCLYDNNKAYITTLYYGANEVMNLTPYQNARYMKFFAGTAYGTTYNHDICINISDASKNGQYEPYESHSYPLDSDLELRGIPKLDSSNNLYYDGDVYEPSGSVTRKYGIVDLGTLDWSYTSGDNARFIAYFSQAKVPANGNVLPSLICSKYIADTANNIYDHRSYKSIGLHTGQRAIWVYDSAYTDAATFKTAMSGVYLVYELATPTKETAQPYASPQVVNPLGTEEYIDTRDVPVPVGHETFYPLEVGYGYTFISDLPSFGSGAIPSDLYLAVDDGENTTKISAIDLVTRIVNSMN